MASSTFITYLPTTPRIVTAPTCVVFSLPQEITTLTHTSGETEAFLKTTYTASTYETWTIKARTSATCLQPGETYPKLVIPGLTPTELATFSTCVIQSNPVSYVTITHKSGQSAIFPQTTYTALTIETMTISARTIATCISPGQTVPTLTIPSTKEGIKCSTTTIPRHTFVQTYAPGVSIDIFGLSTTTRTAAETSTLQEPRNLQLSPALAWALLVITFVTIQLTWWVFDLPLLWKKGAGLGAFFDSVTWACLRSHAAGSAGVVTARRGPDASQFARIYYMGMKRADTPPAWRPWKLWTCIGTDLLTVISTIITLYEACTLPKADAKRHFGVELWVYPSLPVALIGLSLLFGERFFPTTHKGNQLLLLTVISIVIVVGAAVSLTLWKFDTIDGPGMWWISIIFYTITILPLIYIDARLHLFACVGGWFARVGGVGLAALGHYAGGQPYCRMSGKGFGIVYMTIGGIGALLAFVGGFTHRIQADPRS